MIAVRCIFDGKRVEIHLNGFESKNMDWPCGVATVRCLEMDVGLLDSEYDLRQQATKSHVFLAGQPAAHQSRDDEADVVTHGVA